MHQLAPDGQGLNGSTEALRQTAGRISLFKEGVCWGVLETDARETF